MRYFVIEDPFNGFIHLYDYMLKRVCFLVSFGLLSECILVSPFSIHKSASGTKKYPFNWVLDLKRSSSLCLLSPTIYLLIFIFDISGFAGVERDLSPTWIYL